ncbi:hypothetical protein [Castellaniella denitrificans]|uniref:hypothetical protein n=1 Tax=Castellaniella denitrificans TaxID=56119 RepID=UPI00360EA4AA
MSPARGAAHVEVFLSDDDLIAFNVLLEKLIVANYGGQRDLFLSLADGDQSMASDMLTGACLFHMASRRVMRERNMPEAA